MIIPDTEAEAIRQGRSGLSAAMAAAGPAAAGGDTINVYLLDRMEVRTPRDIGSALTMLNETGHLRTRPAGG
jgi:hypothetical protein